MKSRVLQRLGRLFGPSAHDKTSAGSTPVVPLNTMYDHTAARDLLGR